MSLKISDQGGDFEKCPAGVVPAWCVSVVDLGTQNSEAYGVQKKVWILFETPGKTMSDGRPFGVSRFYTASLNEKASLRKDLEGWRGRAFTQEELDAFDLKKILGKSCLINVVHNDKDKVGIAAIMPLPKEMTIGPRTNDLLWFDVDEFDSVAFEKIPEGIQKIIKSSFEYLHRGEPAGEPAGPGAAPAPTAEIPF